MSRKDLLKLIGWDDDLIEFFNVSEEEQEETENVDMLSYTFNEEDASKLFLSNSYSSNVLEIVR